MRLVDELYGEFEVEPIFEELIKTREMQRLKKIHQAGASYLINPDWNVTRYEHSVGVMLLIRRLGGSIEEQIAGLFHDISHTAFSHVADYALKNQNEDYHEQIYREIICASEIPEILQRNGYDANAILFQEENWTILEKSAPKLCADRVDYTLRDLSRYGMISMKEAQQFVEHLTVEQGEIIVDSLPAAEWFTFAYYKEVIGFFLNPENVYANDRLSKAMKLALDAGELLRGDLRMDDEIVYELLCQSPNEEIASILKSISPDVMLEENETDYDISQKQKFRSIDPTVKVHNVLYKTSECSQKVRDLEERARKKAQKGVFIKVIQ